MATRLGICNAAAWHSWESADRVDDTHRYRAAVSGIRSSALARYAVALAVTAASVLARWSLEPVWGMAFPFITLFPAVMFSAWFGGLGPGILATVISSMGAAYVWAQPTGSWSVLDPDQLLSLAVFAAVGIVFSVLNEASRRTAAALLESVERSRVTLASIGDAVIVTDVRGMVTSLNRIAEELTGWSAGDAMWASRSPK